MNVVPLAADSLGVRSMATYVECGQTRNDRISAYATRAGIIFLSHYHEDHFRHDPGLYQGRTVWAKDARRMINPRQAQRAGELWKSIGATCRLDSAEGRVMETAEARLCASPPLAHGVEGTGLGYVVALTVTDLREGRRFVHASDVQGPLSAVAAAYLIRERPDLLYLSGPPAYLESQLGSALIEQGVDQLLRVLDQTGCRVILDHHALRDESYPDRFQRLWQTGRVVTAAGFLGIDEAPLECRRRTLWAGKRKPASSMPARLKRPERSTMIESRRGMRRAKGGAIE